jgi:hypothetical protein
MDEVTKALGPWPILQMVFGVVVLGLGVWSIMRGIKGKEDKSSDDDKRATWEAYNQLGNIEENTFKIVKAQEQIALAVNRLVDVVWNNRNIPPR